MTHWRRFETTSAQWREDSTWTDPKTNEVSVIREEIPNPVFPSEDMSEKWELVGSAATPGRIFWFWELKSNEKPHMSA